MLIPWPILMYFGILVFVLFMDLCFIPLLSWEKAYYVRFALLVLVVPVFMLTVAFNSFAAVSSPSDAEYVEMEGDEIGDIEDDLLDTFLNNLVFRLVQSGAAPSVATPQDADKDEVSGEINPLLSAVPYAASREDDFVNVLRYRVTVGGSVYTLLLPPDAVNQVYIDADGYLWNMGINSLQGTLFTDSWNPLATTGRVLYLGPALGNNYSNNYSYGSPNYVRRYYVYNGRVTYDTDYVTVHVEEVAHTYIASDFWHYVIFFVLLGGVLLLWLRNWRRY